MANERLYFGANRKFLEDLFKGNRGRTVQFTDSPISARKDALNAVETFKGEPAVLVVRNPEKYGFNYDDYTKTHKLYLGSRPIDLENGEDFMLVSGEEDLERLAVLAKRFSRAGKAG